MERGGGDKMSTPSASWENTLQRVKELLTLNKVYLYLYLQTECSKVHTKTTEGQYSPVQSRVSDVSKLFIIWHHFFE